MPLNLLIQQCAHCLQKAPTDDCAACRELLRRALADGNDSAWDAAVGLLWPAILHWIYLALPDIAPAAATLLGYAVVRQFRSHYPHRPTFVNAFPTFATLIDDLRRCVATTIANQSDQ